MLVIDDDVRREESVAKGLRLRNLAVQVRSPDQVSRDDLESADVIAIDHHYDWGVVRHPEECLYWPTDGLAIAAVVASHLRSMDHHAAIVLRTGALDVLARDLPIDVRKPVIAAQNGLDWVFTKDEPDTAARLHEIARAVGDLQSLVMDPVSWNEGARWLSVPDAKWTEAALADVQVCHPAENVVAAYTAGTAWLRWFAQRVLPFPTFLVPTPWAATTLRLDVAHFNDVLASGSPLADEIDQCRYRGHLAGLTSDRWWRAGLDSLVDSLLIEAAPDLPEAEALQEQMTRIHGGPVGTIRDERPVVAIDSDYVPVGIFEATDCIRLAPDFWPAFAQEAWATFEDIYDDPSLFRMVARGDRPRASAVGE